MDSEAQTIAYAEADFNEANSLFTDKFAEHFSNLPDNGRMADLGCGPGDIAIRMAHAALGIMTGSVPAISSAPASLQRN